MFRQVKILGAALVVSMALGAVAASASAATMSHHFSIDTEEGHSTISGEGTTPFVFVHETGSEKNNGCEALSLEGTAVGTTLTELTLSPVFENCATFEGEEEAFPMNFIVNECQFLFTGETTETVTPGEHATFHLTCPGEQSIETRVTLFSLECSKIEPQTIHGVRYEDETTKDKTTDVRLSITAHGVYSTTTGVCGEESHEDGAIATEVKLTAANGISLETTEE